MTCSMTRIALLLAILTPAPALLRADDSAPKADEPAINPGPAAEPQESEPETVLPPGAYVPGTVFPPYVDPQNPAIIYDPWGANLGYPEMGFNFGYGYRPLGYTFWPRYGDYMNFGRFLPDPGRFYTRPYMWHPYWSYQRYRFYPGW